MNRREARPPAQKPRRAPAPRKAAEPRRPLPPPRRSLSNVGGPVGLHGPADKSAILARALEASKLDADALTHGFHSYPARMHPGIARVLIEALSEPGERVLDPFCGSGTVLVEAMIADRIAIGVDLSPLAIRIAEAHCALRTPEERERFVVSATQVSEASQTRVRERIKARAPLTPAQRSHYDSHVLLELAGLFEEIRGVEPAMDRRALEVVFSALLVKFSHLRGETSSEHIEKRLRKGLVSEFFLRKGKELAARWKALAEAAGERVTSAQLFVGDARKLPTLLRIGDQRAERGFDLVVSSPPYAGTYDYHAQHALRYPWLSLDATSMEQGEVGARRRLSQQSGAAARWERELLACLESISAVCRRDAAVVLLLGDAEVGGRRMDAFDQLARLGPRVELSLVAAAAQSRPDFLGGAPRREHLLLLRRA